MNWWAVAVWLLVAVIGSGGSLFVVYYIAMSFRG